MDYVAIFIFVTYPHSRLNVLVSIYYIQYIYYYNIALQYILYTTIYYIQYIHYYNIALLVYTIYKRINHLKILT